VTPAGRSHSDLRSLHRVDRIYAPHRAQGRTISTLTATTARPDARRNASSRVDRRAEMGRAGLEPATLGLASPAEPSGRPTRPPRLSVALRSAPSSHASSSSSRKQAATGPRKSPMRDSPEARQLVDCADRAAQLDGNVLNDTKRTCGFVRHGCSSLPVGACGVRSLGSASGGRVLIRGVCVRSPVRWSRCRDGHPLSFSVSSA
jgi:hypothetical protein